jgi:hypothetical protein
MLLRTTGLAALLVTLTVSLAAQPPRQTAPPGGQRGAGQPARDTSARPADTQPLPTGRISGRVVAGDTGRPVKRARVFVNAAELQGGRGALTDETGVFDFTELPAGRYTVTVSKSGFVSLSYGQRRSRESPGSKLGGDLVEDPVVGQPPTLELGVAAADEVRHRLAVVRHDLGHHARRLVRGERRAAHEVGDEIVIGGHPAMVPGETP